MAYSLGSQPLEVVTMVGERTVAVAWAVWA
jgi:hypothetical protein